MRLHAIHFDEPRRGRMYSRLAAVLGRSAATRSPGTPLTTHRVGRDGVAAADPLCKATYVDNARKTLHHCRLVHGAADGELIGLIDVDTVVLRELSPVSRLSFDIAYTARPPGSRYPFNTGVVFVRVSDRTRRFYDRWNDHVARLLGNPRRRNELCGVYGGVNQCGFALTMADQLAGRPGEVRVRSLPCQEWNCENETHQAFAENTRVVHVLGELRRSLFFHQPARDENVRLLRRIWLDFERQPHAVGRCPVAASGG